MVRSDLAKPVPYTFHTYPSFHVFTDHVRHNLSPGSLLVISRLTAVLALASSARVTLVPLVSAPAQRLGPAPFQVHSVRAHAPSDSDSANPAPNSHVLVL